jgi:hypothetical protein
MSVELAEGWLMAIKYFSLSFDNKQKSETISPTHTNTHLIRVPKKRLWTLFSVNLYHCLSFLCVMLENNTTNITAWVFISNVCFWRPKNEIKNYWFIYDFNWKCVNLFSFDATELKIAPKSSKLFYLWKICLKHLVNSQFFEF